MSVGQTDGGPCQVPSHGVYPCCSANIYKQGVVESERGRRVRVGIRRGESYLHGKMLHQIFCDVSFVCFLLVSACIC